MLDRLFRAPAPARYRVPRKIVSWTESDLQILRTCYGETGGGFPQAVACMPHRTPGSIQTKASEMGLKSPLPKGPPKNYIWTPERLAILRAAYETGGTAAARKALPGFSDTQIHHATKRYNIRFGGDAKPDAPLSGVVAAERVKRIMAAAAPATAKPKPAPVERKEPKAMLGAPVPRGVREHIRRRMQFTIASLSAEFKIPASAVAAAIAELAQKGFEPDAVGRIVVSPEEALRFSSEGCAAS